MNRPNEGLRVDKVLSFKGKSLDIDNMDIHGIRQIIKIIMQLMSHERERVTSLYDRILSVELQTDR